MVKRNQYTPCKALVTGGAGFIGASLVKILLENDVDVRVMVMPGDPAHNLKQIRSKIEVVEGDLLKPESLDRAVQGCDTLFNLAAIYAIWLANPRLMYDVNVNGTLNLMHAALRAGVKRIVHTSSIAAVGANADRVPADEETRFNAWDDVNDYVLSKYISELEVKRLCKDGLPAVIVNPAFPFGWGDTAPTPTGNIVLQIIKGAPFYFDGGFNAVGVRDVAMGHWLAARHGTLGRRYILGNENLTYIEFTRRVGRIADVKVPTRCMSRKMMLRLGQFGDFIADNVTHRSPLLAEKTLRYTVGRYLYYDISRARRELGYEPTPVEQSIQQAVEWFRSGRQELKRSA
jgi:dihydroflavonol-4-reductase